MRLLTAGSAALLLLAGGLAAAAPSYAAETCQGRPVTITVTANNVPIEGTDGPDVIDATGVATALVDGRGGDDVICYGAGALSVVHGGPGDDLIEGVGGTAYGDDGDDLLRDATSMFGVTLVPGPGDDEVLGDVDSILVFGGTDGVTISVPTGTADGEGHDTFSGPRSIVGSPGPDTFLGASGRDVFMGNLRRYDASAAPDVADGGDGDDHLEAHGTLRGGPGADELRLDGAGTALGEDGNDNIWSSRDEDDPASDMRLLGGAGSDYLNVDVQNGRRCDPQRCHDVVDGGADRGDLIRLSMATRGLRLDLRTGHGRYGRVGVTVHGVENVKASMYDDVVIGDAGPNRLLGRSGRDVLVGGGGDDTLLGGLDRDRAAGGSGADRCRAEVSRGCER
ncbi:hypothetical protein GON03_04810 [Nocardioides sp. MAH-18]|uniref:Calcium-binding protein n=1 Tax=Nocardioides agri TaxID=2682843 RepID=A0A6L6XN45_9ACTN|nr:MULTISPECIES: hypothetical protein [unclassified Nocardioides]MBA2953626.1 hypothetical protein [Nocardioides sp. CGMCC 1.13656]MVQ48490.1 hypothetical protein [Nocardioides sp. MAH-18]